MITALVIIKAAAIMKEVENTRELLKVINSRTSLGLRQLLFFLSLKKRKKNWKEIYYFLQSW